MHGNQHEQIFHDRVRAAPVPDSIVKMHEYYRQTGIFRVEYLRRLLGDQRRAVRVGATMTWETFLGRG